MGGGCSDILFIDVAFDSKDHGGVEFVKRFAPEGCGTQVVYVAHPDDYCTNVYETQHLHLLLKPINQLECNVVLEKALANLEQSDGQPVFVQSGGSIVVLSPQKISHIESARRKVLIYQEERVIEAYASLADLAEKLPSSFVRCHKGFLVNMSFIDELKTSDIRLHDGTMVPLGQRRRSSVREAFVAYLQGRQR